MEETHDRKNVTFNCDIVLHRKIKQLLPPNKFSDFLNAYIKDYVERMEKGGKE